MYYNGYIRLYTVTVATLFLLSPLLALPYILLGIYCPTCSGIHSIFITI